MKIKHEWIDHLVPNARFSLTGNSYERLVWHDERPKPTEQEIIEAGEFIESREYEIEQWRQSTRVRTWQLKAILDEDDLLESVEGIVAQSSKTVQLAWNHAPDVMRSSQAVNQILEALQLTPEQGDEIFKRAKALVI